MTTCSSRARCNLASQGFHRVDDDAATAALARAARFQPAATLVLLAVGVSMPATGLASTAVAAVWFGTLAALAWLAVVAPAANVFDRAWDLVVRPVTGWPGVGVTPAPRRFSQGIAATFLTALAVSFGADAPTAGYVVAAVMAVAASLAAFADVCIGSLLHRLIFARPATS